MAKKSEVAQPRRLVRFRAPPEGAAEGLLFRAHEDPLHGTCEACGADVDTITFTLGWDQVTVQGTLDSLLYNGVAVPLAPKPKRKGKVAVSFERARANVHHFQWVLLFPGQKLTGLSATTSINGSDDLDLNSADNADSRWGEKGDPS